MRNPSWLQLLGEAASDESRPVGTRGATLLLFDGLDRDSNESLAILRRRYARAAFAIAADDLLVARPVFASLKQSSQLADEAIRSAVHIVNAQRSLAVFALGRLGTEEFDIASDADLLFLRAPEADDDEARLDAQRVVSALSTYTRDGLICAVDARLRPHGGEGELVTNVDQLERYLREEAQPWEALTYSKIRFVAGRKDVAALDGLRQVDAAEDRDQQHHQHRDRVECVAEPERRLGHAREGIGQQNALGVAGDERDAAYNPHRAQGDDERVHAESDHEPAVDGAARETDGERHH